MLLLLLLFNTTRTTSGFMLFLHTARRSLGTPKHLPVYDHFFTRVWIRYCSNVQYFKYNCRINSLIFKSSQV